MKLGILSDTHGLLRPEAAAALAGAEAIVHAGDVGSRELLDRLREIAPVYAVRGNADREWAEELPPFLDVELGGLRLYVTHKKKDLPRDLTPYGLVVVGHSHQYSETALGGTLLLNPGSCGPRRFHQPITLAAAELVPGRVTVSRVEIAPAATAPRIDPGDLRAQIEAVIKETERGRDPRQIAAQYGLDPARAEQIARLYLTHPGVTAEGIMTKMGF